jgi:hypothetical protein
MKFKQPSRNIKRKTVRRAVSKQTRGTARSQPARRAKTTLKKSSSANRKAKPKARKPAASKRTGKAVKRSTPVHKRPSPLRKPRPRPKAVATRPRIRQRTTATSTIGTIPPQFPDLSLGEEKPTEAAAAYLTHEGVRIAVPAILLETEHPPAPAGEGDGQLHVTARDPYWLYVHWDLPHHQQAKFNAESLHGHLIVRVYAGSLEGGPAGENHVHPQSRHWFAHVGTPGTTYFTELGFYAGPEWRRVATAGPITTPRRRFAFDTSATFVTIHPDLPLAGQARPGSDLAAAPCDAVEPRSSVNLANFAADFTTEQQLAVLRALGVIRVTETVSGDSDAGGFAAELEGLAEILLEGASVSSMVGGSGEPPEAINFTEEFMSAYSADAPLFSLADFPNPPS